MVEEYYGGGVPSLEDTISVAAPHTTEATEPPGRATALDVATTRNVSGSYVSTRGGALDPRVTTESLHSQAERFFAGFARVTDGIVTEHDRARIYEANTVWPHSWRSAAGMFIGGYDLP